MMNPISSINNPKSNAGATFIEALVSVFLVGILSAGTVSVSSRVAVVQATGSQQQLAINQMSNLLRSGTALCTGNAQSNNLPAITVPNIAANDLELSVTGCASNATTIAGKTITNAHSNIALVLTRKVPGGTPVIFVQVGS
jgi:Tfp pilus assembly protein PilV